MHKTFGVLLHLFLSSYLMISCADKASEDQEALFVVDQIQVMELQTIRAKSQGLLELKDTAIYNLKICLKDPGIGKPIINQKFDINVNGQNKEQTTDYTGCISRVVELDYDMLTCESYKKAIFTISNNDLYPGSKSIETFYNPSAGKATTFYDSRYNSPRKIAAQNCTPTKLGVESLSVKRIKNKTNKINFETQIRPSLVQTLIDGEKRPLPIISNGMFKVTSTLMATDGQENILIDAFEDETALNNQIIKLNLEFMIPEIDLNNLSFKLETKITSRDAKLTPAIAVIESNDISFNTSSSVKVIDENITIDSSLAMDKSEKNGSESSAIAAKKLNIISIDREREDDFSQNKQMSANLTQCFYNKYSPNGSELIADEPVKVSFNSQNFVGRIIQTNDTTDYMGCVNFTMIINYKEYETSKWSTDGLTFIFKNDGSVVEKEVAINPWTKMLPVRDTEYNVITKEMLENTKKAQVYVDNITYGQRRNIDDSYYVNKFVQLFFKKQFEFEFKPFVEVSKEYEATATLKALNFGKLKVNTYFFSMNRPDIDLNNINYEDLTLLSATTNTKEVKKSGKYQIFPELPFEVSDLLYLGVKSIMVIEVIPESGLNGIQKQTYAFEFLGTEKHTTNLFKIAGEMTPSQLEIASSMITSGNAFSKGLHTRNKKQDSIDLFRAELQKTNDNTHFFDDVTFLASEKAKKHKILTSDLFKMYKAKEALPPRTFLNKKMCSLFVKNTLFSDNIEECEQNINTHLDIKGAEHVIDVYTLNDYEEKNEVSKGYFDPYSEINNGATNEGTAYFAAYGSRYADNWGTHTSVTTRMGADIFYDGPPRFIFMQAGVSKSHETFTQSGNTQMQAEFVRNYKDLKKITLKYNEIKLSFKAAIKRCVLIKVLSGDKDTYHICEKEGRIRNVEENWYFLGPPAEKASILTDGHEVGEKSIFQIVRGKVNFDILWNNFKTKDYKAVIREMSDFNLGETFLRYKKEGHTNLEDEIRKDHSFPGLMR